MRSAPGVLLDVAYCIGQHLPSICLVHPKTRMNSYRSVFRDGLFAGQAGLVTGAGSGIGRCTAHELAALGARIALVGRKVEKLEAVAGEITDAGGSAHFYTADIREEEQVREMVRTVLGDFGQLDF